MATAVAEDDAGVVDVLGAASTALSAGLSHPEQPEVRAALVRKATKAIETVEERAMAPRLPRFAQGD